MSKNGLGTSNFLQISRSKQELIDLSNVKIDQIGLSPMTSTLKRKEISEKEMRRKEKQEEFKQSMSSNSEGVQSQMESMNIKINKIDRLVNSYQNEMEYVNSYGIQQYLKRAHEFYKSAEDFDPDDPTGQRTYANQYIYRKKLPTSFYYIERQKIRERIQLTTQMQFFHPEWFQQKKNQKRARQDIDYLKLLAKRKEVMNKEVIIKHIPLNLGLLQKNRKALLDEFYAKDVPNKAQRITELQKKIVSESDFEKIEQIKQKHEQELQKAQLLKQFSSQNLL